MSLKFLKRAVTCISAYQLTATNPNYAPCCRCSSRLPQTDAAHPQVRVFTTTEPLSDQQLQTDFRFSSLSCAIPHSSAAEDVGRDGGAS
jgi:hypothetical protein